MFKTLMFDWLRKQAQFLRESTPLFLFGILLLCVLTFAYQRGVEHGRSGIAAQLESLEKRYQKEAEEYAMKAAEMGILAGHRLSLVQADSDSVSLALKSHLKPKEKKNADHNEQAISERTAEKPVCPNPALDAVHLDSRTVGLLNAARQGRGPEDGSPGAEADAEVETTAVTAADLAINDAEIVWMYHDLAVRHDGLVDWVRQQCLPPQDE